MGTRRDFLKKVSAGAAGVAVGGTAMGMSAKSYGKIIGANDKLNVAIWGLGRRLGGFYAPIALKESNVELKYLCDVMQHQREQPDKRRGQHPRPGPVVVHPVTHPARQLTIAQTALR